MVNSATFFQTIAQTLKCLKLKVGMQAVALEVAEDEGRGIFALKLERSKTEVKS